MKKLIPIRINCIVVGKPKPGEKYADITVNFGDEASSTEPYENQAFSAKRDMETGVHLHFILPDFLNHGTVVEEAGKEPEIRYPAPPNLWLVTRLWSKKGGKAKAESFIIRSNSLNERRTAELGNIGSPSYPVKKYDEKLQKEVMGYKILGESRAFDGTIPKSDTLSDFRTVNVVSPYFASYYCFCRNVFGFHDSLSGIDNADLSYSVLGWYEDGKSDDIFHGLVTDIKWKDKDFQYENGILKEDPLTALGNNSKEAFSALIYNDSPNRLENYSNLLFSGSSHAEIYQNPIESRTELHRARFLSEHSAVVYDVKKIEGVKEDLRLLPKHQKKLDDLCAMGELLFKNNAQSQFLLKQAYFMLVKYIDNLRLTKDRRQAVANAAKARKPVYLERYFDYLRRADELSRETKELLLNLKNEYDSLAAILAAEYEGKLKITELSGEGFWQPRNPVFLFSKSGRRFYQGYDAENTENGKLFDREDGKTVKGLYVEGGRLKKRTLIKAERLLEGKWPNGLPDCFEELLDEALLLSVSFAETIAREAFELSNITDYSEGDLKSLVTEVRKRQRENGGQHIDGVFPAERAVNDYEPFWNPLFLEWEIGYYGDIDINGKAFSLQGWELGDEEYIYTGEMPDVKDRKVYSGRTALSPHMAFVAEQCVKDNYEDEYEVFSDIKYDDVLSQELGSLGDALTMRRAAANRYLRVDNDKEFNSAYDIIRELPVDGLPLLEGGFFPVRGGILEPSGLRIVDSFGRYKEIEHSRFFASEHMLPKWEKGMAEMAALCPRIMQPSRICAKWDNYGGAIIGGWLVLNHLDGSLAFYSPEAEFLGCLQPVDRKEIVIWQQPPGSSRENMNPDMKEFVDRVLKHAKDGKDFYRPFYRLINDALWSIEPPALQKTAEICSLIGRPLAFGKLRLAIELLHEEEIYQSVYFDKSVKTRLSDCAFPIKIGQEHNHKDGVIGFFKQGNDSFSEFYSANAEESEFIKSSGFEHICPGFTPKEKSLFIVFDPFCPINLVSGILPVKNVEIDRQLLEKSFDDLKFMFFAGNTICDGEDLKLPVPAYDSWDWSFAQKTGAGFKEFTDLTDTEAAFGFIMNQEIFEGWLKAKRKEGEAVDM